MFRCKCESAQGTKAVQDRRGGKGKVVLLLGLLGSAVGAAVYRRSTEKADPWARAGAYTPPEAGRDSSLDTVTNLATAAKEKAASAAGMVAEKASAAMDAATEKAQATKVTATKKASAAKKAATAKVDKATADQAQEDTATPAEETATDAGATADGEGR